MIICLCKPEHWSKTLSIFIMVCIVYPICMRDLLSNCEYILVAISTKLTISTYNIHSHCYFSKCDILSGTPGLMEFQMLQPCRF